MHRTRPRHRTLCAEKGAAISDDDVARSGEFVRSFERGLAVIRTFTGEYEWRTLSDVARAAGLNRATARRLLLTLEQLGYVRQDDRRFSLTPKVLEIGYAYLSSLPWWEIAQPHMERLSSELGTSTSAAVLDRDEIVYVLRAPTRRIMTVPLAVGTRLPAYATSTGRVLLAHLPPAERAAYLDRVELAALTPHTVTDRNDLIDILDDVARQGWAIVDQELEMGVRSTAAPISGRDCRVFAAINVSTHPASVDERELRERVLPLLLQAATAISDDVHRQ